MAGGSPGLEEEQEQEEQEEQEQEKEVGAGGQANTAPCCWGLITGTLPN